MIHYERSQMTNEQDIYGRAYVHYQSWLETYPEMIDPQYLKQHHTFEKCLRIAKEDRAQTILAKDQDKVIGFLGIGDSRDGAKHTKEIYGLYVLQAYQDQKIGYGLMCEALRLLSPQDSLILWVLKENKKAYHFYERIGFQPTEEKEVVLGNVVIEVKMVYQRNDAPFEHTSNQKKDR